MEMTFRITRIYLCDTIEGQLVWNFSFFTFYREIRVKGWPFLPYHRSVISNGGKWLSIDHLSVLFNYSMHNTMIKGPIADLNCLSLGRMRGKFDKLKMTSLAFNRAKDPSKSWGCTERVLSLSPLSICSRGRCGDIKSRSMFTLFVLVVPLQSKLVGWKLWINWSPALHWYSFHTEFDDKEDNTIYLLNIDLISL